MNDLMTLCLARAKAIVAAYRTELPAGFDPQNSIVSGTVGAVMGAEAQGEATAANRASARETNALNQTEFLRSRGAYGSAVLPMYMHRQGRKFEPQLAYDLMNTYSLAMPDPKGTLSRLKETRAEYMPTLRAAHEKAGDIFDGGIEESLLADYEPVRQARETLGKNRTAYRRQAAIDALQETLAEIDAVQAGKGYSGDSLSRRMMEFGARKTSADDESAARLLEDSDRLLTAQELQAIRDYARVQLPLASVNMPAELLAQAMGLQTMPQRELLNLQSARMQPLTFLRIGAGQPFQNMPMPLVSPVASPWQLLAQGTAQAGNTVADYYMKRDLANQMRTAPQTGYQPQAMVSPSLGSPAAVPMVNTWEPNYDYTSYLYGAGVGGSGGGGYVGDVNIPAGVGGQV